MVRVWARYSERICAIIALIAPDPKSKEEHPTGLTLKRHLKG
jgi:hypothetical protein